MYRWEWGELRVLLVHPGGPFWSRRDIGSWSIPKGEVQPGEDVRTVARREFREELGIKAIGELVPIGRVRQRSGKLVEAFAMEGEFDVLDLRSNRFHMEWPPKSGKLTDYPEVDRAEWFTIGMARKKLVPGQVPLLERLEHVVRPVGR